MKKLNIFIIVACFLSLFSIQSCSKFLDLKPKNTKIVSTIEDYRDILASYMRLLKTPNPSQKPVLGSFFCYPQFDMHEILGIYSGEINLDNSSSYYFDKNTAQYTTVGKNILNWVETTFYVWDQYYSFLGPINLIINGIVDAEGENETMRNYVQGEALVWRAYSYFKLLQYFAPYDNDQFGVPVYLKPYEDIGNAMPPRETQTKVYEQIINDCNAALNLLDVTNSNEWNCAFNRDFIHAMLASVYTYKAMSGAAASDDWSLAEKHATEAILNRKLENSTEGLRKIFNCSASAMSLEIESDEYYLRILDGDNRQLFNFMSGYYGDGKGDGIVILECFAMYQDNDIRKTAYFDLNSFKNDKYNLFEEGTTSGGILMPFRLAEMYLIKAEALCRMNKIQEAMQAFQPFLEARYSAPVPTPNITNLLETILLERRREFYLENDFRWLDMKRLKVEKTRNISGETFTLLGNDFRYSLPIPASEIKANKNMIQTPGWERIILN